MAPTQRRLLLGAALAVVLLLTLARGLVAVSALASAALIVCFVGVVVPLQRDDGIDWHWLPRRADEVPPEPGIGRLRGLLDPDRHDTGAAERLQDLLRELADDRGSGGGRLAPPEGGPLARYLAGAPRTLTRTEAEAVLADLESLTSTKETA